MHFPLKTILFPLLCLFTSACADNKGLEVNPAPIGNIVPQLGPNIMVVFQDKQNTYWFGSWETGLYRYDGRSITHYTTTDGLPSNRVEEIKQDAKGNLLINTTGGLCQWQNGHFRPLSPVLGLNSQWQLHPDDLWFKCLEEEGYVLRLADGQVFKLKQPTSPIGEAYVAQHPGYVSPYIIYCNYRDSRGHIWFGTAALGAFRFDGHSFDWISEEDVTELHDGPSNGVRSIIEDPEGYFWFNSNFRYLITSDKPFYQRFANIGSLDGTDDSQMGEYLSIAKDPDGNLWIATYLAGVWKYDGKVVTHYPITENNEMLKLFYMYSDNSGTIWLGTQEKGAWKFNGRAFEKFGEK